MTNSEKIEMNEQNIRNALQDYRRYTTSREELDDVSPDFIHELARDNCYAKSELRELFRKSPVWNEELDAIVINGNRTHDTNYGHVVNLLFQIFSNACLAGKISEAKWTEAESAFGLFTNPDPTEEERASYIEAMKSIAPKAYAPGKKLSRVFKSMCDALGITENDKGSEFQRLYAQFADELSAKQIDYKLFVSVNPAHFLTMSNPVDDRRGTMLTSCHSFNRTDYSYNNGCSGYARDPYTFIVFTAADPYDPETLNNRKTSRQIFSYKPGHGLLLQSRLYDTTGGTNGAQALSKEYRDLIQRELSALEDSPNLWRTFRYYGQNDVIFEEHRGFGGYLDWTYESFDAKVSVRSDCENMHDTWQIGEYGLCIKCGCHTSDGLYCDDCAEERPVCEDCGEHLCEDDLHLVYDEYGYNRYVCDECLERNYTYCRECEEYYPNSCMTYVAGIEDYVCDECLSRYYHRCEECGEYFREGDMYDARDKYGDEVEVCEDCADTFYVNCDNCGELIHTEYAVCGEAGSTLCPDCLEEMKSEEEESEESEASVA